MWKLSHQCECLLSSHYFQVMRNAALVEFLLVRHTHFVVSSMAMNTVISAGGFISAVDMCTTYTFTAFPHVHHRTSRVPTSTGCCIVNYVWQAVWLTHTYFERATLTLSPYSSVMPFCVRKCQKRKLSWKWFWSPRPFMPFLLETWKDKMPARECTEGFASALRHD